MRALPQAECHSGGPTLKDEAVIVGEAGGLQNVIVFVKDGPPVDLPPAPVVLDQANCRFAPHVVAVRTGQVLRLHSSDPTLHNVRGQCEANPAFNLGMASAGDSKDVTFARPEIFQVRCDVHPWMNGYVGVFDHPLFAVTPDDGRFEIKGVPGGSYTLVAWHERLGSHEKAITVPAAGPVVVEFDFGDSPPGVEKP